MKIERWGMVLALIAGAAFWIIDSILDAQIYYGDTFTELAFTDVPSHELYVRLTVAGLLILFGIITTLLLRRLRIHRDAHREGREQLLTTLRSIGDAVIVTDIQARITFLNRVAVEMTGWEAEAAAGRPCEDVFNIVNEQTGKPAVNPIERVLKEGRVVGLANHTALIRRDGTQIPIDDSGAPIRDSNGVVTGAVLVFHDISERKQAEERIHHLNSVLKAIRNVNQLITQENDPDELARRSCELLVETRGYNAAWIGLEKRNGDSLQVHGSGIEPEAMKEMLSGIGRGDIPSCWSRCRETRGAVITTDPEQECPECSMATCFADSGSVTLRLRHGKEAYGYLSVSVPSQYVRDPEEIALFEEVAGDIAFALHDIELQRRHQEAADRLRHSVENMLEGWVMMRAERSDDGTVSDFRFVRINPAAQSMLAMNETDVRDRLASEVFPGAAKSGVLDALVQVMAVGDPYRTEEYEVHLPDGPVFVDLTAFRIDKSHLVCTFRDVTYRREAELRLQAERDKARKYLDVARVMIVALDDQGRITLVNDKACELLEDEEDRLVGADWFENHIPEDQSRDVKRVYSKLISGEIEMTEYFENEVLTASGERRLIAWHNALLHDESGNIIGTLSAGEDVTERRAMQAALAESEKRYRGLYEGSRDGIVMIDLEGHFLECNQAYADMVGYSIAELRELDFLQITPEKWHKWEWEEIVQNQLLGQGYTDVYEKEYRRKDGTIFPVELRSYRLEDEKGNPIALWGVVRDITERKMAQQRLAESEARFRMLYNSVHAGVVLHASDGEIIHANEVACQILRMSKDDITGRTSTDTIWKMVLEDGTPVPGEEHPAMMTLRTGRPVHQAVRGLVDDETGEMQWLLINTEPLKDSATGEVREVLATFSDITELKLAQAELSTERERLDITLRSIGDGVIATDAEGRITLINEIASRLTGYGEAEAFGKPLDDVFRIINEDSREVVENPVRRVMKTGRVVGLANSTLLISRDGQERAIADSAAPIRNERNEMIGVVLVFRDVTEKRRMQDFAVRAQRLETAGRIAGQVAHDFNNLLAPLMAYPPFIREAIPDNSEVADYIDKIEKAAEQMADINQQLLTLGRRGHYAVETINLNDTARQAIKHFQPTPDTLVFDVELASDLMAIRGGPSQLYRVLVNLLANAMDAMQGVGQLTLRTENFYLDQSAGRYGHIPKGEYVKLSVTDTGSGIPHVILNKVFEPFFTTKTSDRRRGSGLGLSVVHSVVEDHGGYVDFESEMGKGTSFFVYLPVSRDSAPDEKEAEQITGGSELILVVDDDWTQRDVTVTLLEKLGYRASSVDSGEEALELLNDRPVDLIVLDMIMPGGMDGAETYEQIRRIYPDQKAIIVSGYAENERVRYALDLGCGAFVRKPVTLKSIALAVRKELDRGVRDTAKGEGKGNPES